LGRNKISSFKGLYFQVKGHFVLIQVFW